MSSLRPKRASFVGSSTVGISRITESGIGNSPMVMHPIDTHVIARIGGRVVGHVGWARREMTVGTEAVTIAGAGGVLVSDEARGQRLGAELMGGGAVYERSRRRRARLSGLPRAGGPFLRVMWMDARRCPREVDRA